MKNIFVYLSFVLLAIFIGCSDSKTNSSSNPIGVGLGGGGGAGGGSVTFTIGNQVLQEGLDFDQDGQPDDSFYLTAKPSVQIKITKVNIEIPGDANFDSVTGDGTTVYNTTDAIQINTTPYYNVNKGQKFTLKFAGKLAADDKAFEVTTEYTVP